MHKRQPSRIRDAGREMERRDVVAWLRSIDRPVPVLTTGEIANYLEQGMHEFDRVAEREEESL